MLVDHAASFTTSTITAAAAAAPHPRPPRPPVRTSSHRAAHGHSHHSSQTLPTIVSESGTAPSPPEPSALDATEQEPLSARSQPQQPHVYPTAVISLHSLSSATSPGRKPIRGTDKYDVIDRVSIDTTRNHLQSVPSNASGSPRSQAFNTSPRYSRAHASLAPPHLQHNSSIDHKSLNLGLGESPLSARRSMRVNAGTDGVGVFRNHGASSFSIHSGGSSSPIYRSTRAPSVELVGELLSAMTLKAPLTVMRTLAEDVEVGVVTSGGVASAVGGALMRSPEVRCVSLSTV